jgi:hypothetical protein
MQSTADRLLNVLRPNERPFDVHDRVGGLQLLRLGTKRNQRILVLSVFPRRQGYTCSFSLPPCFLRGHDTRQCNNELGKRTGFCHNVNCTAVLFHNDVMAHR